MKTDNNDISNQITSYKYLPRIIKDNLESIIDSLDKSNEYYHKNKFWFEVAADSGNTIFQYLKDTDDIYYDLVVMNYLGYLYVLPVPILAKLINMNEEDILLNLFNNKYLYRDDVNYI